MFFPCATLTSDMSANDVTIPPSQTLFNKPGLLGIMSAAGRFDRLSEDELIAFREQLETETPKRKHCKGFQENCRNLLRVNRKRKVAFYWGAKENWGRLRFLVFHSFFYL